MTGDKEWESTRRNSFRWIEHIAWGGRPPGEGFAALYARKCELSGAPVPTPERFAQVVFLRVAALEDYQLEKVLEPSPTSAAAWELAHAEQLDAYVGQYVAIHPELGIIAASADPSTVIGEVRAKGRSREVVIRAVRTRVSRR